MLKITKKCQEKYCIESQIKSAFIHRHLVPQYFWERQLFSYLKLFYVFQRKLLCRRLMTAKSRSARGASRQPASIGSFLTICQTCLPCLHLVYGCGCSPGLGSGNKETLKLGTQPQVVAWWLWRRAPAAESLVRFLERAKLILTLGHENYGAMKTMGHCSYPKILENFDSITIKNC